MQRQVEVRNWRRSRAFGFGYSCIPTGRPLEVEMPTGPTHVGTIRQVWAAIDADRTVASFRGGTIYPVAWFYKGRRILATRYGDEWLRGFALDHVGDDTDVLLRLSD